MDYTGKYKITAIHTLIPTDDGISEAWMSPDEYIEKMSGGDPDVMQQLAAIAKGILIVSPDGSCNELLRLPDDMPKSEIAEMTAAGAQIVDDVYMLNSEEAVKVWEMRGEDFYTKTGTEGTIFDEEIDPWIKSNQEDGSIVLGDLIQIRYEKIQ